MKSLSLSAVVTLYLLSVCAFAAESRDSKFVSEAAMAGMAEVELSMLASQQASNDAVREYAQKVVQDHQQANEKLKTLASQKNINLPNEADRAHKREHDKLAKKTGADFDKDYIDAMIKDHKKVIKTFDDEAKNGKDADLKAFAEQTSPELQEHLAKAQQLEKEIKAKR